MHSIRMGKLRMALAASACLLLLVTGPRAMAQAVFGQIVGTVTDTTGAAIPGATVTVTDTAKGTSVTLQSNGAGEFTAEHLIPDTYTIKVAATGFKGYQQSDVQVFADTSPKVNAVLAVGGSDQVVEVNADQVPQLKTDKTDVATVFNATEIEDLPIPDHNFANLQLLLPGAVQLGWAHAASENPQGSKQIQIDGQAFGGVNYTLDGTDNQDAILGIIVINPNSESMSEAKIATQNFDAEFGKAVASVQTVQTKSGTNAFHGSLFDNRESNANLARDPFSGFNQTTGKDIPYPSGLKNQFGGSIGGPIIKDRIFFFADYQGVRQKVGSTETASVPSLLALNSCTGTTAASNGQPGCDFSDYINAANLGTTPVSTFQIYNNNQTSGTATLGSPFAGNIIPLALVSPQAQNLFKLLLANKITPNHNTGPTGNYNGLYNNYAGSGAGSFNSNQWDVRGDATISQKIHAFGRFSRFTDTLSGASLFGPAGGPGLGIAGYGGVSQGANDSLAMGVDIAVTQKLVTDVRLGYFRYDITTHKNDPGNTNLPFLGENVGTSALPVPVDYGTPDINIADLNVTNGGGANNGQNAGAQFGTGLNMNHCNCPLKEKEDQFQIVNNWTREIGTHAVKFGVDLRYARNLRVPSDADRTGVNNFGEGPTSETITTGGSPTMPGTSTVVGGLGWASFILGDVTSFNRYTSASPTEPNAKEFQPRDFFYAQDTWRATPKLTVNAGLRYEYYAPERVNGAGNGALLNLATGYINVAGEGGVPLNMGVAAPKFAFNPRMGVAYQIDNKTVIRAGYGRSFDLGVFGSTFGHVVTQNIPVLANQSVSAAGGPQSYAFNLSNPSVTGNGATNPLYTFVSPTITNGQIAINEVIPGTNPSTTIGHGVSVKARPFTERLPTLDAWNAAVQRSITPTMTLEVSYVGNKGTHTLSDGDGNNTNPNEPGNYLPASYVVSSPATSGVPSGTALHFDPSGGNCITGATVPFVNCNNVSNPVPVTSSGATKSSTLLERYVGGSLPACGGPCGWDQGISYYGDDQDTHYNALQLKLTKTFSKGYSISANYAFQVGTDAASGYATWDKAAVIGNDSAIRRKAFTAYGLYKLPFGKDQMFLNQSGVVNYIVGGWEFSPTFVYQSGLPFTIGFNSCGSYTQGPCYVNGDNSQLKKVKSGYAGGNLTFFKGTGGTSLCSGAAGFSGFTCSGLDSVGDGGRNNAFGPGFFNSDMSISKGVSIHERYEVKFRMDAYNAFNHINFGNPNGTIDQGSAGSIGSGPYPAGTGGTTNPRQLQFTIHLAF